MKITIIGSGCGVPSQKRASPATLLEHGKQMMLIDIGMGTMRKMTELSIDYRKIDTIFITHFHPDHTLDLISFLFTAKYQADLRKEPLTLIGAAGLKKLYSQCLDIYGEAIKPRQYELIIKEAGEEQFDAGGLKVTSLSMQHAPSSIGFRFSNAQKKTFAISGDTDYSDNLITLGKKADLLILECSLPEKFKSSGHLTPAQCGTIAERCRCKRLILNHIYPLIEPESALAECKKYFKGPASIAGDGQRLQL